jgi:hypothetical protein
MAKVRKVCKHCGSENVAKDAWSNWDVDKQEWVLYDVFDYEFCKTCEGETTIVDEEINEPERSETA